MSLYTKCPDCQGTGEAETSNCCDAKFDSDIRICSECLDHVGDNECYTCDGTGKILKHVEHDEYNDNF